MTKPLRTQFVVADASHARFVTRAEAADDFVTTRELKSHTHDARGHSAGGHDNVAGDQGHEAFAREVADAINGEAQTGHADRIALIAPAPTLRAISAHLSAGARARLCHTLAKDLSKTPDHALGDWLRPMELG